MRVCCLLSVVTLAGAARPLSPGSVAFVPPLHRRASLPSRRPSKTPLVNEQHLHVSGYGHGQARSIEEGAQRRTVMHANPLFMGGVVTSLIGNLLTLPLELFLLSASFIGLLVSAVFTFLGTSIISLFAIVASLTLFSFIFGGLIMTTVAAFGTIATMAAFFGTAAFTGMFVMGVLRAFAQPFLSANQQRFPAPTLPRFTRQRQSEMRRVPIGRQQQQQQQGVSRERQEAIERIEDDVSSRADLDDWDARMKKKVIDDLKL